MPCLEEFKLDHNQKVTPISAIGVQPHEEEFKTVPIISILILLIVVGVVLWLVNTYIPMAPPIKTVINVIVVLLLCVWLLNMFGVINYTVPIRR